MFHVALSIQTLANTWTGSNDRICTPLMSLPDALPSFLFAYTSWLGVFCNWRIEWISLCWLLIVVPGGVFNV